MTKIHKFNVYFRCIKFMSQLIFTGYVKPVNFNIILGLKVVLNFGQN